VEFPEIVALGSGAAASPLGIDDLAARYGRPGAALGRLWLRATLVTTLDGRITGADGSSESITTRGDKAVFGVLRRLADAVLVGGATALAEPSYQGTLVSPGLRRWRLDHGLAEFPALVIVSSRGLPPGAADRFSRPAIVVESVSAFVALAVREGWNNVLCEGGPTLLGRLAVAGLLDELCLTLVPRLQGGDGPRVVAGPALGLDLELGDMLRGPDGELFLRHRRAAEALSDSTRR